MFNDYRKASWDNFLGHAPHWYKWLVVSALAINPVLFVIFGPVGASWAILLEFIGTLMMALRCYPLQPGGLIWPLQAAAARAGHADCEFSSEMEAGLPVLLLLDVHGRGNLLLARNAGVRIHEAAGARRGRESLLAFLFVATGGLSFPRFLDALTVLAVIITVAGGFYAVYHRVACWEAATHRSGSRRECGRRTFAEAPSIRPGCVSCAYLRGLADARCRRHHHRRCLHAGR